MGCSDSVTGDTLVVIPFERMSRYLRPCPRTPAAQSNYGRGGNEEQEAATSSAAQIHTDGSAWQRNPVAQRIQPDAPGIDCGSEYHYVAVPPDRDPQPVRAFRTFTTDLYRLADWLVQCGVKTVAMESTGVYWLPIYEILEARGLEVVLVNARHLRNVRGRKSDVSDCEWLRDLHSVGLLSPSFRPADEIVALRSYTRQRESLVQEAATDIQRMQKALTEMNLLLHVVLTDITGVTGLKIVRSILDGERDPARLATHRDHRCKASPKEIMAALTGNYRAEHLFALRQNFAAYQFNLQQIAECDHAIQALLNTLAARQPPPPTQLPPARRTTAQRTRAAL